MTAQRPHLVAHRWIALFCAAAALCLSACGDETARSDEPIDASSSGADTTSSGADASSSGADTSSSGADTSAPDEGDVTTAAQCGDGVVQRRAGEVCDDGNTDDGDGCSADCSSDETCGNGALDSAAGELCDDGNTDNGDTCSANCRSDYRCGNGVVDTTASGGRVDEVCDDSNTANGDGCSADCLSDEVCGNAVIDFAAGEVCDDGNTDDGDDCSADCLTSALCGNGTLDAAEECDDGNNADADGCAADCRIERCGNGRLDPGEACDDGNTSDGDGCDNDCTWTCADATDCADADACNGDEVCQDPGTITSACASAASPAPDGTACGAGQVCRSGGCTSASCGDGIVSGAEQCDDANSTDSDGCDNDCTWTCAAAADCADANACNGAEVCLSPNTIGSRCGVGTPLGDGTSCGANLICLEGACAPIGCGDGVVSGGEQCDDANSADGDGCDSDCTWTCAAAADCADTNACNGAEVCQSPSTLGSRCAPGTTPPNGTTCGGANICVAGGCVAARCGDGIVSGGEQCDDANTANGDGCDNDCAWTCAAAADCADANACNGAESCQSPGTLGSRCAAGSPLSDGMACDRDATPATRDICRASACVASACGDGFIDGGNGEQCDDGNNTNGDGCSGACLTEVSTPPTGFRITTLQLISPRVVINVGAVAPGGTCQDITQTCARYIGFCVADSINQQIGNAINPTTTTNGTYSLHIVNAFDPLVAPSVPATPLNLHFNAACDQAPTPDACTPDPTSPDEIPTTANNRTAGACFTPVASQVNGLRGATAVTYTPTANTTSAPCYVTNEQLITVNLSGILVPLSRARVSATYSGGSPATTLVSGVVSGFLSAQDAASILLPDTLPAPLGGAPLYTVLQAAGATAVNSGGQTVSSSCNISGGGAEDDRDTLPDGTRGFWFYLNFEGERVTWTE